MSTAQRQRWGVAEVVRAIHERPGGVWMSELADPRHCRRGSRALMAAVKRGEVANPRPIDVQAWWRAAQGMRQAGQDRKRMLGWELQALLRERFPAMIPADADSGHGPKPGTVAPSGPQSDTSNT